MTNKELREKAGLSIGDYRQECIDFVLCEGYDDDGNEYDNLYDWIMRKKRHLRDDDGETMIIACEQGKICGAS